MKSAIPPASPPGAVIYGRLSQGDAALESHEKRNLDYAAYQKFTVIGQYEDEDTSGGIAMFDRTGGRSCLNRLRHGNVRHLIVAKLDRIGRWAKDVLQTIETLEEWHVTLHIVDFGGDTVTTQGHMGKFILTVFAGIAEWERSEIRDRTQKRADHKFSRSELIGTVPYGYDCLYAFAGGHRELRAIALTAAELSNLSTAHGICLSKTLIPNALEQATLLQMWTWRYGRDALPRVPDIAPSPLQTPNSKLLSLATIADRLNQNGIPAKQGGLWQCGNVDKVLKSRHTRALLSKLGRDALPRVPDISPLQQAA